GKKACDGHTIRGGTDGWADGDLRAVGSYRLGASQKLGRFETYGLVARGGCRADASRGFPLKPAGTPGVLVAPVQTGIVVAAGSQAEVVSDGGAIDMLAAVWLTGLLFTLGRLITGVVRSTLRRRRATPSDIPVNRAGVDVRISGRIAVPRSE